jgi:hypothetical protein
VACWQVLALHSERKKALADRLEKHREASGGVLCAVLT